MRALTEMQRAILEGAAYAVHARVLIEDADGNLANIDDAEGGGWFIGARWSEDIDHPVADATIELRRDAGDALSLSPLRTDSPVNRDSAGSYAPRVDVGRRVAIEVATTAPEEDPTDAAWQRVFHGVIDAVADAHDPMVLTCRDLGGALVDKQIETETEYGDETGVAIETVMQQILDDHSTGVTLYTPASPGFLVTPYVVAEVSVMQALRTLAELIGWDVRYRWDEATGAYRLTFYEPDRTKAIPDYTFGPDVYLDVRALDLDIEDVRNVIEVVYVDAATGEIASVTAEDAASIARYGRRFMRLTEADSPIDTAGEAQDLADAALADLKDPAATHAIETLFFWPVELGDLLRHEANAVHYDTDQDFAVVRIDHEIRPDRHRTTITARGTPAGAYLTWLAKGATADATTAGTATIQADPSQSGGTGTLTLHVRDPQRTVVALEFQKRSGGGVFDGNWLDTWDSATGTPGTDQTLTRAESVALVKGHNSEIKWRARYIDDVGIERVVGGSHVFDSDVKAEVQGIQVSPSATGTIVVSAQGDEDTATLYATAAVGMDPPDPTAAANDGVIAGRSGTVDTGIAWSPGAVAHVKVVGENAAGALGDVKAVEVVNNTSPVQALPPVCDIEVTDVDSSNVATVRVIGTAGEGGPTPTHYRRRAYRLRTTPPAFGGLVPLVGGEATYTESLDAPGTWIIEAQVVTAGGVESAVARASAIAEMSWADVVDDDPTRPRPADGATVGAPPGTVVGATLAEDVEDGSLRAQVAIVPGGGALSEGTGIRDGMVVSTIYRHREEVTVFGAADTNADGVVAASFGQTYQNAPAIALRGHGCVAFSATLGTGVSQKLRIQAANVTVSGFDSISQIVSSGATTPQTDNFPSGTELTSVNDTTVATLNPGGANDNRYTVHYYVEVVAAPPLGGATENHPKLTVAIDTDDGTGFEERAVFEYAGFADTSGFNPETWPHEQRPIVVTGLSSGDQVRLRIKAFDPDQGGSFTVRGGDGAGANPEAYEGISYTTAADTTETAIPADGDFVEWIAQEVV